MKIAKNIILYLFLVTIILFSGCMLMNKTIFWFDAGNYWALGGEYWKEGKFSLYNYPESIRGYFFPLILGICRSLGKLCFHNEYILFRFFQSSLCVVCCGIILPCIFDIQLGTKRWNAGTLFCVLLFGIFWKDLILTPLSDMSGVFWYLLSILWVKKLLKYVEAEKKTAWKTLLISLLLGGSMYGAYNIRTVYLIPCIILTIVCLIRLLLITRSKSLLCFLAGMFAGTILMAFPQMLINNNVHNEFTPKVITQTDNKDNLFVAQLQWGISRTRYETYMGKTENYPSPSVNFINETGQNLSANENIQSIKEYISFVFTHPIEMSGIYLEHLISGITVLYNDIYITDLGVNTSYFILNILVYILALIGSWSCYANNDIKKGIGKNKKIIVIFLLVILPSFFALPGALEPRFFIAIYLCVYMFICFKLNYKELWRFVKSNYVKVIVAVIIIILVWNMCSVQLLNELEYGSLDFRGNIYLSN